MTHREVVESITPEADTYPLDDALITLIAELRQQAQAVEQQSRGALMLFIRQHGLKGNWQLSANGRELVRPNEEPIA